MAFSPERLREARESLREHGRRVSQERFAEMIGVSKRSPSRWENREAEPRMAQLVRIVAVTGKPIGYFFEETAAVVEPELMADLLERLGESLLSQAFTLRKGQKVS